MQHRFSIGESFSNCEQSTQLYLLLVVYIFTSYIDQCSKWFQLVLNVTLIEYNRITCNTNINLPFIGHKRMFSFKVLISVLLLEVLVILAILVHKGVSTSPFPNHPPPPLLGSPPFLKTPYPPPPHVTNKSTNPRFPY